jgi:hypothetical protein
VIRVYDSFGAPMQMELVKQVSLRSDGVVRERCRTEELILASRASSHLRDLAFEAQDDRVATLGSAACAIFNLQFICQE